MEADLFNLQTTIGEVNGLRSNYQIGLIPGEIRELGVCNIETNNKKFDPSESIRGDIARTYKYIKLKYPKIINYNKSVSQLIIKWNKDNPVDK